MKSDSVVTKNRTLTMESYNRQLLRYANIYSKVMGDYVRSSEKMNEMLAEAPKDFTLVDVIRVNWQLSAKLDSSAGIMQKIENDHFNKVSYIEEMGKRN